MKAAVSEIESILAGSGSSREKVDLLTDFSYQNRNISPTQALQAAEAALELATKEEYSKGMADSLLQIGFCNIHAANHEKASDCLFKCIAIYGELNDEKGIANAEYNLGIVHLRIGNFDESIKTLHKSLAYREQQNDEAGMAACYFQISYINQHFNDTEGAEESALRALELYKKTNQRSGMAAALMVLGEIYLKRKEFEKARSAITESLELRKESDEKLGYFATMLRLTELHIELNELDKASEYAERGLYMATTESVNFGVIRFLQMLGRLALIRNNLPEAKKHHLEALAYSEQYSFKSIIYEQHQALAELYEKEGNYKEALENYRKFHTAKEYLVNFQSNTRLKSVQFINQIETARREAELEKEKNAALNEAYKIISEKQKEILDSIHYAKRIQQSLLPNEKYVERALNRLTGKCEK